MPKNIVVLVTILVFIVGCQQSTEQRSDKSTGAKQEIIERPSKTTSPSNETSLYIQEEMNTEDAKIITHAPPSMMDVKQIINGINIKWKSIGIDGVSYRVYRKEAQTEYVFIAEKKGETAVEFNETGVYEYFDRTISRGNTYTYAISSVNSWGAEGNKTEPITITFK